MKTGARLQPSPAACFARGEGSACSRLIAAQKYRSPPATPSLSFGGGLRGAGVLVHRIVTGRPCSSPLPPVRSSSRPVLLQEAPLAPSPRSLILDRAAIDARGFIAGSSPPAAVTHSSQTAAADRSSLVADKPPSCSLPR